MNDARIACMKLWVLLRDDEQASALLIEVQAAYERLLEDSE